MQFIGDLNVRKDRILFCDPLPEFTFGEGEHLSARQGHGISESGQNLPGRPWFSSRNFASKHTGRVFSRTDLGNRDSTSISRRGELNPALLIYKGWLHFEQCSRREKDMCELSHGRRKV